MTEVEAEAEADTIEVIDPGTGAACRLIGRILEQFTTEKSHIILANTVAHGQVVIINKEIQSSERDEKIYHSALVRPAIRGYEGRVVILGGGEGCTAREVLAAAPAAAVDQYDYDEEFVHWCKRALRSWNEGAYESPRLRLQFADAFRVCIGVADAIIIDMFDITEENWQAYRELICNCSLRLRAGGRLTAYLGDDLAGLRSAVCELQTLLTADFAVSCYTATIPSYGGEHLSLFLKVVRNG